jgi:hypothetical protein
MTLAPFILAFVFRALQYRDFRYFLWAGLFLALSLLGGIHPSNSYTILAVIMILFINPLKRLQIENKLSSIFFIICGFILLMLTAFILSAIQILPSIELTRLSVRAAASGYHQATQYSWEPYFLLTVLFPFFWGNPSSNTLATSDFYWEFYAYAGILPLILIIHLLKYRKDRTVLLFASLALLSILLALGKYSPLFFLYKLPLAGLFRAPARFLFLYVLSISILTGIGLDDMIRRNRTSDHQTKTSITLLSGVLMLLFVLILYLNQHIIMSCLTNLLAKNSQLLLKFAGETHQTVNLSQFIQMESKNIYLSLIRFFILFGLALLSFLFVRNKRSIWWYFIIILLQFLDLYSAGAKLNPTTERKFFDQKNWAVEHISRLNEAGRVASIHTPHIEMSLRDGYPRAVLTEAYNRAVYQDLGRNVPALLQIPALTGDSPLILRNYHRFLYAALSSEADPLNSHITWRDINHYYQFSLNRENLSALLKRNSHMLNLANAIYLVTEDTISAESWIPVYEDGPDGLRLYRNSVALPRARFVPKAVNVGSPDEALMRYLNGDINPQVETVISGNTSESMTDQDASPWFQDSVKISWVKDDALEIKLGIFTPYPGYLILADNYYPGWKASVDGIQTEIYNADICFRAVHIPTGAHDIRFYYEPSPFRWGLYISLCGVLLFIVLQIGYSVKRTRR